LNRHTAFDRLLTWGPDIILSNDIPPQLPAQTAEQFGSNDAEETLRGMLERSGLPGYQTGKRIPLGPPLNDTLPDFFYEDPEGFEPGLCIYLDGMSDRLHGNPETAARDRRIREQLRSLGYQVIEMPYGHLTDREQMRRHFYSIGRILLDRDQARQIRENPAWFDAPPVSAVPDNWNEIEGLLDHDWHQLAHALRDAGIVAPDDVDWDIPVNGIVSGERAVMIWQSDAGPLLLVNEAAPNGFRHVVVNDDYSLVITAVRQMLEEAR
jgi:hypothetical protein